MVAKNAPKPRPSKNSDGQNKRPQPTMTHSISIEPGKPTPPPPPPGAPAPGHVNPMTHPAHPAMQSSLGAAPSNPNPSGNPLGNIVPTPTQDNRQVRENIQFKDMNPAEQSQVATQQGLDPYAPLKMVQQGVQGALQQGASSGPIPNELAGPYVPPGVESFPDDMAHLTTLMGQGFAPGASPQEHELAQNAHSLAHARLQHAFSQAQNGAGQPQAQPLAPAPQGPPPGVGFAPGIPEGPAGPSAAGAPPMQSSMGSQPPTVPPAGPPMPAPPMQPGAPGGIPPAMIAAMLAKAKAKRPVR